jgi:excisionase family DNA binding protein
MNISTKDLAGLNSEELAHLLENLIESKVKERVEEELENRLAEAVASHLAELRKNKALEPLMSLQEAAEYLGVSERQVHYFLEAGQLTSIKVGRKHQFEPKALQRAARGGLQTPST